MGININFKRFVEKSNSMFYVTSLKGEILYINDFGKSLLGITPDDINSGINVQSFYLFSEDRADFIQDLQKGEIIQEHEIRLINSYGKKIIGHEQSYIVPRSSGVDLVYGSVNDISDFIELNLNTARLNLELADINQKLQDAYTSMAQQEKMATIGELAAGVAHEINNPLGFIISNTNSVGRYIKILTEIFTKIKKTYNINAVEGIDQLEFILTDLGEVLKENKDGLRRIATITDSLKRFSRMGDENNKSNFDLNQAIKDTLTIAKTQYKYIADIELNLGDIPPVFCNGDSINQVLLNLIVNAAHAIDSLDPKERGLISIQTSVKDADVVFQVTDSGSGISDSIKNKIFDPFFTTKEVGKGTGLGLSLCYDIIVQKHGGKIWVENSSQGGAIFSFTLPGGNYGK